MGSLKPLLKKIWQKDKHHFVIEWTDGLVGEYNLGDLEKRCPCALCSESKEAKVKQETSAIKIKSVGRYALRIQFTKGCSMGIYDYEFLYGLAKEEKACV